MPMRVGAVPPRARHWPWGSIESGVVHQERPLGSVPEIELAENAGDVRLDGGHTDIQLSGDLRVRLAVADGDGNVVFAHGQIHVADPVRGSSARATIAATSVHTRNSARDAAVRSAQYLDTENHPEITFVSTHLDEDGRPLGPPRIADGARAHSPAHGARPRGAPRRLPRPAARQHPRGPLQVRDHQDEGNGGSAPRPATGHHRRPGLRLRPGCSGCATSGPQLVSTRTLVNDSADYPVLVSSPGCRSAAVSIVSSACREIWSFVIVSSTRACSRLRWVIMPGQVDGTSCSPSL